MNKNAECYYESAKKLNLLIEQEPLIDGFKLLLGKRQYFFYGPRTPLNLNTSSLIAHDKHTANKVLEKAGFPVPKSIAIYASEFNQGLLETCIKNLTFPLVIKPRDGTLGRDVICNIQNLTALKTHLHNKFATNDCLIVQEFHGNLKSYRILVLYNKIIGVVIREPSFVIGDGSHTLHELIEITNINRNKLRDFLGPICIDEELHIRLQELQIDLGYIPAVDERVTLGYASNATRGGVYQTIYKKISKENKQFFLRAAQALNLNIVGFDVECPDIDIPIQASGGVIIEANPTPSIRIHEKPMEGTPVMVSKKIILSILYRHPFAYLNTLCKEGHVAISIKSALLLIFLGLIYICVTLF
ncbi:UDP-N-acetylmuramyl tripeptide synthase [Legionella donaldsonii]|uniref:UDP-N-acetylmuramyl tripeptide synthase n=1 Tax=Legionella donaldsonii TaxID=45060 RepID=A0A378IZB6_9GAMM|nr:UDP-N-acetylmuramyl peptide synthase [Legionella donaldsonii]STX40476.1 UDP-N-acetylmuramyl tripeptide synthase [Legionella donaldsonii]